MSFEAFRWAQRIQTGSPARKSILLTLAQFADEMESCFPKQARYQAALRPAPRHNRARQ